MDGGGSAEFSTPFTRRSLSLVMQSEQAECGLACLTMIARYHGHDLDLMSLRRRFSTSLKGVTLAWLVDVAGALGFEARPLRVELGSLRELRVPCILHWNLNHFVVLRRMTRGGAEIHDPARGACRVPLDELSKHFSGVALELGPSADFAPIADVQQISLRTLAGQVVGLKPALLQMLGLALAIETLTLLLPFQIQWIIDQVLVTSDRSLLVTIGAGFLLLVAAQTGLALGRGSVITWFGASLNAQWATNLFGHLLRLPLDYFEKRHMSDVLSRFTSLNAIQSTLTGSFVESLLDGLMGMCTLVILACYSPSLTCIALATFGVYALLRFAFYRKLWRVNEEQLVFASRQQSELMESVRGVQAIKLANKHAQRRARVANATLDLAERDMRKQRMSLAFNAVSQGLFGVQRVAIISWGAWICLNGTFSAGLLVAFVAYADQFATRLGALIDKVVEFRMLRLHAARIADIALAAPERDVCGVHSGPAPAPSIVLENISFCYAEGEPWIVRHLNMNIDAGESVAIVGPSGCGKSTLAKLILGLLVPSEGTISVGGIDIRSFGLENYRAMMGAVMQDDQLFSGTIADNISFCDEAADMSAIEAAARAASVHDAIMDMPMGYETLVGDMGSSLSGGQRQRVIFARALYRKPKILVLDEATSHLDIDCERSINRCVDALNMTRIIIAHRPETIASASRVIEMAAPNARIVRRRIE